MNIFKKINFFQIGVMVWDFLLFEFLKVYFKALRKHKNPGKTFFRLQASINSNNFS
jgi:hypothetical protein